MAEIDNLNFKVILDDAEFDKQIKRALETAEKFNLKMTDLLKVNAKLEQGTKSYSKELRQMTDLLQKQNALTGDIADGMRRLADGQKDVSEATEGANRAFVGQDRLLRGLKGLAGAYFSVAGAERLVRNLIRITGEFEMQRTTLRAILQDVNAADAIFDKIKQLAVVSPFTFKDLISYTKQLSAFSVPVGELYDTTKMLADVSAGLGVGMDRLILAYGQIRSASFLRGQEVRQLTEAGVPILVELQKQFEAMGEVGITVGDVFDKISARQVPFEMVAKVFKDMTSEGGKFYRMQEVQAETLQGKISNLTDAYQLMFSEVGEKLNPVLKASVDALRTIAEDYDKVGRNLAVLIGTYGAARVALKLFTAESLAAGAAQLTLTKSAKALWGVLAKNPYTALAAGIAVVGYEVYRLITYQTESEKMAKKLRETQSDLVAQENAEIATLDVYITRVKMCKEGTDDYNAAKGALMSKYSAYIEQLRNEGVNVSNLAALYDGLASKIRASAQERLANNLTAAADKELQSGAEQLRKRFDKQWKNLKYDGENERKTWIWGWITGAVTDGDLRKSGYDNSSGLFKDLKDEFSDLMDVYTQTITQQENLAAKFRKNAEDQASALDKTAGAVKRVLSAFNITDSSQAMGLWYDASRDNYDSYLQKIRNRYKEINTLIADSGRLQSGRVDGLKQEKVIIEAIAKDFGVALGGGGSTGPKAVKGKSDNDAVNLINRQVNAVKKLYEYYKKLKDVGADDKSIIGWLNAFLPGNEDIVNTLAFSDALEGYAAKLEGLGESGKAAAEDIRRYLGSKGIDGLLENLTASKKAREDYENFMESWLPEATEGEGMSYKISKIVASYKKTLEQIAKKEKDARDKLNAKADAEIKANQFSALGYAEGSKQITSKADADRMAAQNKATEEARKAVADYYKEWRDGEVDFRDLSSKTIAELQNMADKINGLSVSDLDDKALANLQELGLTIDQISEILQKLKGQDLDKLFDGIGAKDVETLRGLAKNMLSLTASLEEYYKVKGDNFSADMMRGINDMADVVKSVAQGFKQGGAVGAVVAGLTSIAQKCIEAATEAERMRITLHNVVVDADVERIRALAAGFDSVFGDGQMSRIRNIAKALRDAYNAYAAIDTKRPSSGSKGPWDSMTWLIGDRTIPEKNYESLVVRIGNSFKSLSEMAGEFGMALYKDGVLNEDLLQAIIDGYSKLSEFDENWMTDAIKYIQEYRTQLADLKDEIESVFGDISSSIADKFIESFLATGDAASDLTDIFDQVGQSIAKNLIQNMLLSEDVLGQYQGDLLELFKNMDGMSDSDYAARLSEILAGLKDTAEKASTYATDILQMMEESGISFGQASGTSELTNGIKSITEDTASLLASYVNAIRADVAANRLSISDIQQTNLRIAVASEAILSRLNDAMGAFNGGGEGFKVVME